jgi:hypothetical protein
VFEIGNSLREARVRQQIELSEVETATKIRARYLRALEEESFEVLPAQTYVKGFLRNYADYLGLDGQLYVDEYNSRFVDDEEPREPVVARRSTQVRRQHRRLERRGVLLALGGIAVLFAFVIAAWKFSGNREEPPIPNLGKTQPTTTKKKAAPPVHQTRARTKPVTFRLYMRAQHGNCWMDVRPTLNAPKSLYTGTLELGQDLRWVRQRLWISFGNPGNLAIVFNGKLVSITRGGDYLFTPRGFRRVA